MIGAGPTSTYVMDRLAGTISALTAAVELDIHVYDRSGEFGAGEVHSPRQPRTSFLNRIVGQVAFAADESVRDAGPLLPRALRPTLIEWCRRKFEQTGDEGFDLAPEDWPKRYVHGLALRDSFDTFVGALESDPRVSVHLHHTEVVDLVEGHGGLHVVTDDGEPAVLVQQVLMVTGHSSNDPDRFPRQRRWNQFARDHGARFVPSAYPLERSLPAGTAGPQDTVACFGMGLTAIDVIMHLTEGRGGTYRRRDGGDLEYLPSGAEPHLIVVAGEAGLFTFARPFNAKEQDLARLEHRGVFLTEAAVDHLRESVGRPVSIGTVRRRQLDFDQDVFPLVILEMAYLYNKTLFGADFAAHLAEQMAPGYDKFLHGGGDSRTPATAVEELLGPLEKMVDDAALRIDAVLRGQDSYAAAVARPATSHSPGEPAGWAFEPAFRRYLEVVFGPEVSAGISARLDSPEGIGRHVASLRPSTRHGRYVSENRFSWPASIRPIPESRCSSPEDYRNALIDFMRTDHAWAEQDNLTNPAKAAADGVWRDLRSVLAYAIDFGGLTAQSHRIFLEVHMRQHNRLANGAALEVMQKMLALIEQGLLDASTGPGAVVDLDPGSSRFVVRGRATGSSIPADVLVDARVHAFDPAADVRPIYPNLLRRGLIRKWTNPGEFGDYEPGGLDLTPDFHPVRADGSVDERLTFLGAPSEGVMFFQLGALRPHQDHHVMQDVLCWIRHFWRQVELWRGPAEAVGDPMGVPRNEPHAAANQTLEN